MSFTTAVKEELCGNDNSSNNAAAVYGFRYALKTAPTAFFYTESKIVLEFIKKNLAPYIYEIIVREYKNGRHFQIKFNECAVIQDGEIDYSSVSGSDETTGMFLRGVFIACGVVSDPNKEYHFELSPGSGDKAGRLAQLINEHGINVKLSSRKGTAFVYTKESEVISDLLTYMGAMLHSMEIMNVKIFKDVRNNVNRAVNCDTANIAKTVNASRQQQQDIEFIIEKKGIEYLSEELRQVALLRRENVDLSLREIGEMIDPKLSRSGVNHRFQRIKKLADELRETKEN